MAAAIAADVLAFLLWNVSSRSPARVVSDAATAARAPGRLAAGVVCALLGVLLLAGSVLIVVPLVVAGRDLVVLETLALFCGLAVDQLVGAERRAGLSRPGQAWRRFAVPPSDEGKSSHRNTLSDRPPLR